MDTFQTTISLTASRTVLFDLRPVTLTTTSTPLPRGAEEGAFMMNVKKLRRPRGTKIVERRRRRKYFKRSLTLISKPWYIPLLCNVNVTEVLLPTGIVYSFLARRTLSIKGLGCTTLWERRSKLYPFFVLPLSFSVNGTEGGSKEEVKCAPLFPRGETRACPMSAPFSRNKSSFSVLLLIFSFPATVIITLAFSPVTRKGKREEIFHTS